MACSLFLMLLCLFLKVFCRHRLAFEVGPLRGAREVTCRPCLTGFPVVRCCSADRISLSSTACTHARCVTVGQPYTEAHRQMSDTHATLSLTACAHSSAHAKPVGTASQNAQMPRGRESRARGVLQEETPRSEIGRSAKVFC